MNYFTFGIKNMKTNIKFIFAFLGLIIFIFSCDKPDCKNNNPIFDKYTPNKEEYKAELVKQLSIIDKTKLRYWFSEYVESNGKEYLYFQIQGDNLCAKIVLKVEQWNKLEQLRQKKGVSYRGAEFINLQFDIKQDSINTEFIFRDFDEIID
jgi:hypothetical protein